MRDIDILHWYDCCLKFWHDCCIKLHKCILDHSTIAPAQFSASSRQWHPTPVLLPGKSHGCRSLAGCSPWGRKESDMTKQLHFHSSLSCIGVGNGNSLQCSCLENPRDGGAWWAAVYGVAQSWTRLKQLSSNSKFICIGPSLGLRFVCVATTNSLISWKHHIRARMNSSLLPL